MGRPPALTTTGRRRTDTGRYPTPTYAAESLQTFLETSRPRPAHEIAPRTRAYLEWLAATSGGGAAAETSGRSPVAAPVAAPPCTPRLGASAWGQGRPLPCGSAGNRSRGAPGY